MVSRVVPTSRDTAAKNTSVLCPPSPAVVARVAAPVVRTTSVRGRVRYNQSDLKRALVKQRLRMRKIGHGLIATYRYEQTLGRTYRFRKKLQGFKTYPMQAALYASAFLLLAAGSYIAISGWQTNQQLKAQIAQLQQKSVATSDAHGTPAVLGSGTTNTVPSTEKPTEKVVREYTVAPSHPKYITIPKLSVFARTLSMSVDSKNELQAPYGIYDAGWYNASAKPGEAGAMLVDGHSGLGNTHGIFHDLEKLANGVEIVITKGDGSKVTYIVAEVKKVPVAEVDMASMMVSKDPAKPGLNLITCAGAQISGTFSLDHRILVYAAMQ